jgi:hypothetical protein
VYLGLRLRDRLGWYLRVHLGSHLGEHRRRQPIKGSPRTRAIRDGERTLVDEPNYMSCSIVKLAEDGDVGGRTGNGRLGWARGWILGPAFGPR